MFMIGCHECRQVPMVRCNERLDILVSSLQHEKQHHAERWNATKEEVLRCAIDYQNASFVETPEGSSPVEYVH